MPCSAPCERFPCDERCDKQLPCGHICPSVCGETCPPVEFCQTCCTEDRKGDLGVDMLGFVPYGSIDLDESPILVLSCGHFFTSETLDGYLELHKVYRVDGQNNYTGFVDPEGQLNEKTPTCPTCRRPFLQYSVRRYGRVINRAAIMEMTRKFLASTCSQYKTLADTLFGVEQNIYESHNSFLATMSSTDVRKTTKQRDTELKERLQPLTNISTAITKFIVNVNKQRQPANKLYEMTVSRKAHLGLPETQIRATLYFRPDTRLELLAKILHLRSALRQASELASLAHHLSSVAKSSDAGNLAVFINRVSQKSRWSVKGAIKICRECIADAAKQSLPGAEVETLGLFSPFTWSALTNFLTQGSSRNWRPSGDKFLQKQKENRTRHWATSSRRR